MWGAATSAHQVEGDNRLNDWWAAEIAGRVPHQSGAACEHFSRYEADLDLAAGLAHNAYRFSLEWSRIEPAPGKFSEQALAHYAEMIAACRARGLEPIVTLHHFTNPAWFAEAGGWAAPASADWFARYVRAVVARLGPQVRWWITINEPTVLVFQGYLAGIWPPGEHSFGRALAALRNLVRAHRRAYAIIHSEMRGLGSRSGPPGDAPLEMSQRDISRFGIRPGSSQEIKDVGDTVPARPTDDALPGRPSREPDPVVFVGLAHHMRIYAPCDPPPSRDEWPVRIRRALANRWLLRACRGTMDFIGLNYYTRDFLHWVGWRPEQWLGEPCQKRHHKDDQGFRSSLGWEIYPAGLRQLLEELKSYQLPILITENGVSIQEDAVRWQFIEEHLRAMAQAMAGGAPVIGYLYWSLLDNFEWADGFAPRFGLIEVDYATQARRPRPSAAKLAALIRSGDLPE